VDAVDNAISVRRATPKDGPAFLELLVELARFEHLEPPNVEAKSRIVQDIFKKKRARLFVASSGKKYVGYALYFYTYSSFLAAPTLYLEDIFILEKFRRQGIGLALFIRCVREAVKEGCGRMEWSVLTWNKNAIEFYDKLGARRLDEWYAYRLTAEKLKGILGKSKGAHAR
jgi:GNAT superfamily N-acetyltransferase